MKQDNTAINRYRNLTYPPHWPAGLPMPSHKDGNNGYFTIKIQGVWLNVAASDGEGWDHVSVSRPGKNPTWNQMCAIKDLFFRDDELCIQYHPPKSQYVNVHQHCLHLWRPQDQSTPIPTPPLEFV